MNSAQLHIPGYTIAYRSIGDSNNPPILALHGWLDNANSFEPLAQYLQDKFYFIAVDLPGHGHSSHIPAGCHYHFSDGIYTVLEIMDALKLDKVHLLGHSMGACLASLLAGVSPDRIRSLSLIEGLGPFSSPAETACNQLSAYYKEYQRKAHKTYKGYKHFDAAVLARAASGYVSQDIAQLLCERAIIEKDERYHWRHDRRLLHPSPLRMTEEQILSCLNQIISNTYLLMAKNGFSFDNELMKNRLAAVKNLEICELLGGHHIHMEEPEAVAQLLAKFYAAN